jgi:hypothetical protein
MTEEERERTIHFLVENQVKFHSDLGLLKDILHGITENQQRTDRQIQALTERVDTVVGAVGSIREDLRASFDQLILTNEVTRELTVQIGKLAVQTIQRVTNPEPRSDGS